MAKSIVKKWFWWSALVGAIIGLIYSISQVIMEIRLSNFILRTINIISRPLSRFIESVALDNVVIKVILDSLTNILIFAVIFAIIGLIIGLLVKRKK